MTYLRVIPRDLFNEANLLKCYGQLYLNLERLGLEDCLVHKNAGDLFHVVQFEGDGSISLANVTLVINHITYALSRPLNSREPYPLYLVPPQDDEIPVFNQDGTFTHEMHQFLREHAQ